MLGFLDDQCRWQLGSGAVAWCLAAVLWLTGADVSRFAPLMAAGTFAAGLAVSVAAERAGLRIAGVGLAAQALWLARFDVARRTVRMGGVTRLMAAALLAGYVWLAAGGVLWTACAALADGPAYDASLHAVFLGFVMSMVFAHAPVIVPAVLRLPLPFRRGFYAHLLLLHASLALRLVGGDLAGSAALWRWGGVATGVAILVFLGATVAGVVAGRRVRRYALRAVPS
ncbi:MAG TPA: hypothetical protein VE127_13560 [Solirubrobacteraceae bacterium]|nr:hypothetical protein [Solirubrobacteraceae bacterium]